MLAKTIAHYELLDQLGEGGMGVVYRARDTRLDREVAIKALPEVFASDPERLARFEREAKVLASLNHPHIASIHGMEKAEGQSCLILELVEGESLAERIARGPVPVRETLELGCQIAEALEAAHEHGIIHRDLKPANIKVTPGGQVKVLDFGLAKTLIADARSELDPSLAPTLTAQMTQAGVILGTASYMSPEQSRGQEVDGQTDIWAFGAVLYEMLTGQRLFAGDTVSDTIAAIIERQPDWDVLPPETPPLVRSLLRRCLQKDQRHRLHDSADLRLELEEALAHPVETPSGPDTPAIVRSPLRSLVWLAAGLVIGALAVIVLSPDRKVLPTSPQSSARLTVDLSEDTDLYLTDNPGLAISRDGKRIAWVANLADGGQQIFVRELDQFGARPLPGTEGARGPFFSPDGRWIAYFDRITGGLRKISLDGGAPVPLCEAPVAPKGGTWGTRGEIVFSYGHNGGLHRVSEDGGESKALTVVNREAGERSHRFPHFLPDGRAVLFMVADADIDTFSESRIEIVELGSGGRKKLVDGGMSPRFAPSGHLLYSREGELMAALFDPDRLELAGPLHRVLEGVITNEGWGFGQYDLAATGTLLYAAGGPETYARRFVQYDRQGEVEPLGLPERVYDPSFGFSPDGRSLATVDSGASFDVWLWDVERQNLSRLTRGYNNRAPIWSPDSKRLAFKNDRPGASGIYWLSIDGSDPAQPLLQTEGTLWPGSWSPDGKLLVYSKLDSERSYDLWVLPINEDMSADPPRPFLSSPALEHNARFSPDGRWLAYRSDETGRPEIVLRSFPGPGPVRQVSSGGGRRPAWGRNGDEIFYLNPAKRELMRVAVQTFPELTLGVPEPLFQAGSTSDWFAVTPDGDHFVFLQPGSEAGPVRQLRVVFNWLEELQQTVSAGPS